MFLVVMLPTSVCASEIVRCILLTRVSARTWPANGRFTEPQRELYQAVLNAQKALIGLCRQDANMSMWDLHKKSCELLRKELRLIGFDFGGRPDAIDDLFPHFLTHPIGIGEQSSKDYTCFSYLWTDLHESDSFDRHGKWALLFLVYLIHNADH